MCLQKIEKTFEPPDPQIQVGYKVVVHRAELDEIRNIWYPITFKQIQGFYEESYLIPIGTWLLARWQQGSTPTSAIHPTKAEYYKPGFHIYTERADADEVAAARNLSISINAPLVIRKVLYAETQYLGTEKNTKLGDRSLAVAVAHRLFYPPIAECERLTDAELIAKYGPALKATLKD